MAAYWIARGTFHDMKKIERYAELIQGLEKEYPYEIVARGGKFVELEGASKFEHYFIWKFPSMDVALGLYNSTQYQAAASVRQAAGRSELVIVEGGDSFAGVL